MAYNNYPSRSTREWDQGKSYGYDQYEGASNKVRPRDEEYADYGGQEKRRRYDNGDWQGNYQNTYDDSSASWAGYTQQQGHSQQPSGYSANPEGWHHDDRPPRQSGQSYQQHAGAGAGAGAGASAGAGAGPNRRRLVPSEPSPHVIFLGLDSDHTEADLHGYLLSMGCSIDNVTIIRDRSTGLSKGFGFAQFTSTEHAKTFVNPRFPFISIPPPASHGASALQAYKLAVDNGTALQGRRIKIDFSQSAHPPGQGRRHQANDGTRDIGNTQAPVVLLRGLDFSSTPAIVAQGLRASAGPGKEGAKGMRRVVLVKDKYSNGSWGFGFVEFVDSQSSSAFLADIMSPQLHPSGFRIADRPIAASFAHPYSFQPLAENMIRDDACISSSIAMGGVEGTWARYWDESAAIDELAFDVEAPVQTLTADKDSKPKKKKEVAKVVYADDPAPAEASELPISDKPVTLSFKGSVPSSKTGPVKVPVTSTLGFSTDNPDAPNDDDETSGIKKSTDINKGPKKVGPLIASKKVANNITKWNQVQEELNSTTATTPTITTTTTVSSTLENPAPVAAVVTKSRDASPHDEHEFSDTKGLACLLCSRKFKTLEHLSRHNKDSDLHKKNVKDSSLRELAAQKVKTLKTPPPQMKYRDRASERRILHNQPEIPPPEALSSSSHPQRKHVEAPAPAAASPSPPVHPGKDGNNIGNKLLKKMGWSEGTGLGTEGDGRIEPIPTAVYAQGAGLGASKAKDIAKYAESFGGGYVNAVRDLAKERYASESQNK